MGYKELHERVEGLGAEVTNLQTDVSAIKVQVTNHLPTALEEIKVGIKTLDDRLKPLETKITKSSGVSEFFSLVLKVATAVAAVTWTIIQIYKVFHG